MTAHELPIRPNGHIPEAIPLPPIAVSGTAESEISVIQVEPDPDQPRKYFDEEQEQALMDSLAAHTQLVSGIVYRHPETGLYRLIDGERRWRAICRLGWKTMRVRVLNEPPDKTKCSEVQLVSFDQRQDLSDIERCMAYENHITLTGCTASALAQMVGKHVSSVTRAVKRAQRLSPTLKERYRAGTLPPDIAEELLTLPGDAQLAIANQYPDPLRTLAEVKAAVRGLKNGNGTAASAPAGFTCEESGVRIAITWTTGKSESSPGQALAAVENAIKIVLKDLREQGHRGLANFQEFLNKKAKAAKKSAELQVAQTALARHAGTGGNGGN